MENRNFLTDKEIGFVINAEIYPDYKDKESVEYINLKNELFIKVLSGTATEEEKLQYYRVREIELFIDLLNDEIPDTIEEVVERYDDQMIDDIEKKFYAEVILQKKWIDAKGSFDLEQIKQYFVEQEEQNLDEPFIQDLINKLHFDYEASQRYERMNEVIQGVEFKYLSRTDLSTICLLIFKELSNPSKDKKNYLIGIDKDMLKYLVARLGFYFSITNGEPNKQMK